MRLAALASGAIFLRIALLAPAEAWWDEGHMQIAYVAYKRLDGADALL